MSRDRPATARGFVSHQPTLFVETESVHQRRCISGERVRQNLQTRHPKSTRPAFPSAILSCSPRSQSPFVHRHRVRIGNCTCHSVAGQTELRRPGCDAGRNVFATPLRLRIAGHRTRWSAFADDRFRAQRTLSGPDSRCGHRARDGSGSRRRANQRSPTRSSRERPSTSSRVWLVNLLLSTDQPSDWGSGHSCKPARSSCKNPAPERVHWLSARALRGINHPGSLSIAGCCSVPPILRDGAENVQGARAST